MGDILCWLKTYGSGISPIIVLLSIVASGCAAYRALITQRELACKRATLDFLVKAETDEKALQLWEGYRSGLAVFKIASDKENFSELFPKEFHNIRAYLNIFELIACGICEGILDKKMCKNFYDKIFIENFKETYPFIELFQNESDGEDAFCEFVKLAKEWELERELQNKGRRGSS